MADDLDHIIVTIEADVSDFRREMKGATGELDSFAAKGQTAGQSTDALAAKTRAGGSAYSQYATQVAAAYGITDPLNRSQVNAIKTYEQLVAAQKLSGDQFAVYSALQKAGTDGSTQLGRVISALALEHYNLSSGVRAASIEAERFGGEIGHASSATKEFRETAHALRPILDQFGTGLGGMSVFASAARGGIGALALAVGGAFIASLENAGDKLRQTRNDFSAILGPSGGEAFDAIKKSAEGVGAPVDAATSALRIFAQAQQQIIQNGPFRFAPTDLGREAMSSMGFIGTEAKQAESAVVSLSQILKIGGATFAEAQKEGDAFTTGLVKFNDQTRQATGLTKALFDELRSQNPQAANLLAQSVFNSKLDISSPVAANQLLRDLDNGLQVSANQVIRALAQVQDQINALAANTKQTLPQAFSEVGQSWKQLEETLAEAGAFHAASGLLDGLASGIRSAAAEAQAFYAILQRLGGSNAVQSANLGVVGGALGGAVAGGMLGASLGSVVPVAGTILGGVVGAGVGGVVGGAAGGILGGGLGLQGQMEADQALSGSNGVSFDLPQFASGGLSIVSGSGGADSQLVQFMATPGEVVAVGNPASGTTSNTANASLANALSHSSAIKTIGGQQTTVLSQIAQMNASLAAIAAATASGASATGAAAQAAQSAPSNAAAIATAARAGISGADWLKTVGELLNHGLRNSNGQYSMPQQSSGGGSSYRPPPPAVMGTVGVPLGRYPGLPTVASMGDLKKQWMSERLNEMLASEGNYNPSSGYAASDTFGPDQLAATPFANPSVFDSSYYQPSVDGYGSDAFSSDYYAPQVSSDYSNDPNDYGYYASGGEFTVPGSGATDSVKALLHVTPGEHVSVSGGETPSAKKLGSSSGASMGDVTVNFIGVNPSQANWSMSRSQAKRQIRALMG